MLANCEPAGNGAGSRGESLGLNGVENKKRKAVGAGDEEGGDEETDESGMQDVKRPRSTDSNVGNKELDGKDEDAREGFEDTPMSPPPPKRMANLVDVPTDVHVLIFRAIRSRFDYLRLGYTCQRLYGAAAREHSLWFSRYCSQGWYETGDGEPARDPRSPIHRMPETAAWTLKSNFRNVRIVEDLCKFDAHLEAIEGFNFHHAVYSLFLLQLKDIRNFQTVPNSSIQLLFRFMPKYPLNPELPLFDKFIRPANRLQEFYFNVAVKSDTNYLRAGDRLVILTRQWRTSGVPQLILRAMDMRGRILWGRIDWQIPLPNGEVLIDDSTFGGLFKGFVVKNVNNPRRPYSYIMTQCHPRIDFHAPPLPPRNVITSVDFWLDPERGAFLDVVGGPLIPLQVHGIKWAIEHHAP
ncbi:hypothetical protein HK104_002400 [Borealophlyctis nickersoniae]|nr:hypothetical protein HK104_002400 [Borealophlyctis nickersoniae]